MGHLEETPQACLAVLSQALYEQEQTVQTGSPERLLQV